MELSEDRCPECEDPVCVPILTRKSQDLQWTRSTLQFAFLLSVAPGVLRSIWYFPGTGLEWTTILDHRHSSVRERNLHQRIGASLTLLALRDAISMTCNRYAKLLERHITPVGSERRDK